MLAAWSVASAWTYSQSVDHLATVPWSSATSIVVCLLLWTLAGHVTRPRTTIAISAIAVLAGAIGGSSAARPATLRSLTDHDGGLDGPWRVLAAVAREPTAAARGSTMIVDVDRVWMGNRWQSLRGRVEVQVPEPPPRPNWYAGARIEAWLRLQHDRPPANPARAVLDRLRLRGIDLRSRLKSYGQVRLRGPPSFSASTWPGRARDLVRAQITATFRRHAGLVRALVLGERRDLDESLLQGMARSGLIHLLAISGLHVGLLAVAPAAILRVLGRSPRASWAAGLCTALALIVLTEPRAPIQRAATMAICLLGGRLIGRRVASTDALSFALALIVAAEPAALQQLGFQLSAVATATILLCDRGGDTWWLRTLRTSLAAQAGVAPLLALQLSIVPVAGLLLNVVAIPLVSAALVLTVSALVVSLSGLQTISGSLAAGAESMFDLVLACPRAAAYLGLMPIAVASASTTLAVAYGTGLALAAGRRGRLRAAGIASAVLAAALAIRAPPDPPHPFLLVLDVGQGDALLVASVAGAVLVDAGGYPSIDYDTGYRIVAPELRRLGLHRLDAVAVSHDHADHVGGVPSILRHFNVAELWQGATPTDTRTSAQLLDLARSRNTTMLAPRRPERAFAGCRWQSFAPTVDALRAGARQVSNDASLVLAATCGAKHVVLTGDAGVAAERHWDLAPLSGAILKVGHHGSGGATSEILLQRLQPRHAVISVGATNPWSLPRSDVLQRLRRHQAAVYRTDRDGALTIELGARIRVRGERWRSGNGR